MTDYQMTKARQIAYKYELRISEVIEQIESLSEDPDSRMTIDMAIRFLDWSYSQDQVGV